MLWSGRHQLEVEEVEDQEEVEQPGLQIQVVEAEHSRQHQPLVREASDLQEVRQRPSEQKG